MDAEKLAKYWEEYVNSLPPSERNAAIAVPGYPYLIRMKDMPEEIRKNPELAALLLELMLG